MEVFKATLLDGHGYGENAKADSVNIIVNETMLKTMGMPLESAVGTKITVWQRERTIIGVVKDFNFNLYRNLSVRCFSTAIRGVAMR
ncbi:MAG: hypothetical protein WDO15_05785 [Bacteroidota bacterium]